MKIDKKDVAFTTHEELQDEDDKYWAFAPIKEKMEMITYLRECFYGPKATTGRLQRFYSFAQQE